MLGHSVGEYVAACLAGVFSLEDALALVAARGRLMQSCRAGAMLAVPLPEAERAPLPRAASSRSPRSTARPAAWSPGRTRRSQALRERLGGARRRRPAAPHLARLPLGDDGARSSSRFAERVARVPRCAPPRIPYLSNVTGTWITAEEATDPGYWARHLRGTVRFADGLGDAARRTRSACCSRSGPGNALAHLARAPTRPRRDARDRRDAAPPARSSTRTTWRSLLERAGPALARRRRGRLAAPSAPGERRRRVPLPTYPFERQRYWVDPPQPDAGRPRRGCQTDPARLVLRAGLEAVRPVLASASCGERTGDATLAALRGRRRPRAPLARRLREAGRGRDHGRARRARSHGAGTASYRLDPRSEEDYEALAADLEASGELPRRWSDRGARGPARWSETLDRGFYSLLFLAQDLAASERRALDLRGGRPAACRRSPARRSCGPSRRRSSARAKVIPQEIPHDPACRQRRHSPPSARRRPAALVGRLLGELRAPARAEPVVACRGGHRWVQAFEPVELAQETAHAAAARGRRLPDHRRPGRHRPGRRRAPGARAPGEAGPARPHRRLARRRPGRRTGRAPARCRSWKSWAPRCWWRRRRADRERLREVASEARRASARSTASSTPRACRAAASSRPRPAKSPRASSRPRSTARSCSTRSSRGDAARLPRPLLVGHRDPVAAGPGRLRGGQRLPRRLRPRRARAAACSPSRSTGTPGGRWAWRWRPRCRRHCGLARREPGQGLSPAEGVEALERVLRTSLAQVAVSQGGLPGPRRGELRLEVAGGAGRAGCRGREVHARPVLGSAFVAPRNELEEKIAALWQEILGIDRVGRSRQLLRAGRQLAGGAQGHLARQERAGRPEVSAVTLFEGPTVAALAAALAEPLRAKLRTGPAYAGPRSRGALRREKLRRQSRGRSRMSDCSTTWRPRSPSSAWRAASRRRATWSGSGGTCATASNRYAPSERRGAARLGVSPAADRSRLRPGRRRSRDGIDLFDALFFGISHREAELLDPQQRLFLEICLGGAGGRRATTRTDSAGVIGVFAGADAPAPT